MERMPFDMFTCEPNRTALRNLVQARARVRARGPRADNAPDTGLESACDGIYSTDH